MPCIYPNRTPCYFLHTCQKALPPIFALLFSLTIMISPAYQNFAQPSSFKFKFLWHFKIYSDTLRLKCFLLFLNPLGIQVNFHLSWDNRVSSSVPNTEYIKTNLCSNMNKIWFIWNLRESSYNDNISDSPFSYFIINLPGLIKTNYKS